MVQHPGRDFERSAIDANVFAQEENVGVALHFFPNAPAHGLEIGHLHGVSSVRTRYPAIPKDRGTDSSRPTRRPRPPPGESPREAARYRPAWPSGSESFFFPDAQWGPSAPIPRADDEA